MQRRADGAAVLDACQDLEPWPAFVVIGYNRISFSLYREIAVMTHASRPLRRSIRRLAIGTLAGLLLSGPLAGCAFNPAMGLPELSLLSRDDELALGAKGDAQIAAEFGFYDEGGAAEYVARIGQAIAAKSDDPTLTWHFRVLDSPVVNAFALPGGYVYVTRGLLAHLQNEAQLAMVLGHEIGHITARHSARQMTGTQLTSIGLVLGATVFTDLEPYLGILATGLQLLDLKYSRDDERWADDLGIKYATRAGYKAEEGAKFFTLLKRLSGESDAAGLLSWISTHPDPAERETYIPALAQHYRGEAAGMPLGGTDSASYLSRLDQLIYGDNPRHGFIEDGRFYHPDLRFQFPVPRGWQVDNFAEHVQLSAPKDATPARALLSVSPGSPRDAAEAFTEQLQATILDTRTDTVNGMPTVVQSSRVTTGSGDKRSSLRVLSYFIAKDGKTFAWHGLSTPADFEAAQRGFRAVFEGFADLTDPALLQVQPQRLSIVKAPHSDTFQALVQPPASGSPSLDDLAIMNHLHAETPVLAGSLLKTVR